MVVWLFVFGLLLLANVFFGERRSGWLPLPQFEPTKVPSPTLTITPSPTGSRAVRELVGDFEQLHRDADIEIRNLFTPPATEEEQRVFNSLAYFPSGELRQEWGFVTYRITDYGVQSITERKQDKFEVLVWERRASHSFESGTYLDPVNYWLIIEVVKTGDVWLIDKYDYQPASPREIEKYGGFE